MRKPIIAGLLGLNALAGLLRYANPAPFGTGRLWDLASLLGIVRDCTPESFASALPSAACESLPPYLPGAFLLYRSLATMPWPAVEVLWYAATGLLLVAAFAREAAAWAGDCRVTPQEWKAIAFAAVFASLLLFKGTSLGYLAGQPSLVVSLLLYAFAVLVAGEAQVTEESAVTFSWWQPMNRRRWLAACCLAAAASKPNLAAPFFLYLLLRRDAALLVASIATTLGLHVVVGFFWIGPAGYAALLWRGPQYLQAYSSNVVEGMGATGRIDLEPLLAIMGMSSGLRHTLLGAWGVAALAWILRKVRRLSDRELLVALNAIFLALLYHRDYDLVVFVLLALPLLRASASRFSVAFVASSLPFVLPLQFLREVGLGEIPTLAVLWNLVGCSMVVGVVALTAWLLHGSSRARQEA